MLCYGPVIDGERTRHTWTGKSGGIVIRGSWSNARPAFLVKSLGGSASGDFTGRAAKVSKLWKGMFRRDLPGGT